MESDVKTHTVSVNLSYLGKYICALVLFSCFRTDEIIHEAIREKFTECTVITIAHRLNTIMDSDRILVSSKGQYRLYATFSTPSCMYSYSITYAV